jgi:hypothetical protein
MLVGVYSQSLSDKPLTPWIIAEANGKILFHTVIIWLGVASVLWAIECRVQIRNSVTATQKKAYWVIPNAAKEVPYAPVNNHLRM